ncbi:SLC13 family permease [Aliidiomarina soli]|uniref:Sodium:dicarboxylate symporter n=1 Tax=Aliidiomarina soli TaxID=1928574 RepID=A0A432WD14_9GAMM|nr:SLC13 family permease [Aliidiomarina soli]RUO30297.1 sodium:dicarboxylate symporter [Aliidiomarina soli]
MTKTIHQIAGPVVAVVAFLSAMLGGMPQPAAWTLGVTVWVAWWWISEAIPIPATSLLPFVLLPLGNIMSYQDATLSLGNHVIVLFMAAFMLARGIEASGVHERIALGLISRLGGQNAKLIVFSFMAAVAFLSMWISNTASVLALLPVAVAIASATDNHRFKIALLLGLAYAASLGGVATLIGSPPNLIFASVYQTFNGEEFGFLRWMYYGVPIVMIGLPVMALWLTRGLHLDQPVHLREVGEFSVQEKRALAVFGTVVGLWVFRSEPFGGWMNWFSLPMMGDATVALAGVVAMFLVSDGKGGRLLTWERAVDIPWGILLLFAGGICLAQGFMQSGLSETIGGALANLTVLPTFLLVLLLTLSVSFLTEITSNTATATLLMPILASTAIAANLPLELLMIPAVVACSCAFCLPVATPPNSIVFSSNMVSIKEMSREGFYLNIILGVITSAVVYVLV